MKLNVNKHGPTGRTHGGALSAQMSDEQALRRSVMACLLWERGFYESGEEVAARVTSLVPHVKPGVVAEMAIEARKRMHLRHVPLLLVDAMVKSSSHRGHVSEVIAQVVDRPDEMAELLAIYWRHGRHKLPAQMKKGLARAFTKFDRYQLAKYNRKSTVRLRDVMFLVHPKPVDAKQAETFRMLADDVLPAPDTWEVSLSAGKGVKTNAQKAKHWKRLLKEKRLGAMALLRNLHQMEHLGVPKPMIHQALEKMKADRVLPFRYIAAARQVPKLEPQLERAMIRSLAGVAKLSGTTVLVIDVSGSMCAMLSGRSTLSRLDTAAALAVLVREVCEDPVIYATAGSDWKRVHKTALIPARRGFALADEVVRSSSRLGGGGIFLKQAMDYVAQAEKRPDRVIVLTDEQDCDDRVKGNPAEAKTIGGFNYMVNVASARNGIGYGRWTHIDGWSEAVLEYIRVYEQGCN